MIYLTWTIIFLGCFLLFFSAIAFLRSKDLFVMIQPIKIFNFYAIPLILIALLISKFSAIALAKILIIIILNLIITNFLCHLILTKANKDKIKPDADLKDLTKKKSAENSEEKS